MMAPLLFFDDHGMGIPEIFNIRLPGRAKVKTTLSRKDTINVPGVPIAAGSP
ncbi:MAG: hypothetical protein N2Z74_00035 [Syntrophales bacterium]|nr:hypothetical protein [Syntrophales bacterium]